MRTATAGIFVALFAVALALPADGAGCKGGPSLCDPALPGLDLPVELEDVTIASFEIRQEAGRWKVDLALAATLHPGEVKVYAWRYDMTDERTWAASAGAAVSKTLAGIDAGPTNPAAGPPYGAHTISIEWQANGETWRRSIWLHYPENGHSGPPVPGSYHFTAGTGTRVPWWLRPS